MVKNIQTWDPENYARNARFVSTLGASVLELLHPMPGERILDLGCGDGALTLALVEAGCQVIGVDASPEMVAAARQRGLTAFVVDGQALSFDREFDAVFSNAALHWMKDADAVLAGVARALKPGGRFVGEFGGHGNIAQILRAIEVAMHRRGLNAADYNPWYFPTPAEYQSRLERHGFSVPYIELIPRPTPLPNEGIRGWLETFAQSFLVPLPPQEHDPFLKEVETLLEPHIRSPEGNWVADYVRLRFSAILEPGSVSRWPGPEDIDTGRNEQ